MARSFEINMSFKIDEALSQIDVTDAVGFYRAKDVLAALDSSEIVSYCEQYYSDEVLDSIGKKYVMAHFDLIDNDE